MADARYHSSSAGRTRGAEEQWSNAVPYLTSKADPYSLTDANPNRSWAQSVTQKQVGGAFDLHDVVELKETAENPRSG